MSAPGCDCPPCPGRGKEGHGMTHCAECCFGSGVAADLDCPLHGDRPAPSVKAPDLLANLLRSLQGGAS